MVFFCGFLVQIFAEAKPLAIGIYDLPPHMILSASQPPRGAIIDYLKSSVFVGLGFEIQWHPSVFSRTIKDLEESRIDMAVFVAKTPEREKVFSYSQLPIFTTQSGLVVAKDFKLRQIKKLEELKGLKLGHDLGSVVPASLQGVHFEFVSGEDYFLRNLNLLSSGRTQGFFVPTWSNGLYQLESLNADKKFMILQLPTKPLDLYIVYRHGLSKDVIRIVDSAVKRTRKEYGSRLIPYFKPDQEPSVAPQKKLALPSKDSTIF